MNKIDQYNSFYGWFRYQFGHALKVKNQIGQTLYLNKNSLFQQLTGTKEKDAEIEELALEILNPIEGKPITTQDVQTLLSQAKYDSKQKLIERLEKLKLEKLGIETIPYIQETLENKLQPGDIIARKYHNQNPNSIVTIQKIFKRFLQGNKEREGYKFSHIALYLGREKDANGNEIPGTGRIAEAAWTNPKKSEIRSLLLSDERFKPLPKNEYHIYRLKDNKIAQKAVEVAKIITTPLQPEDQSRRQETELRYSKFLAAKSLLHNPSFGPFAKYRYIRNHKDFEHEKKLVTVLGSPKSYFCSYLVGASLQIAEAQLLLPKIIGTEQPPTGVTKFGTRLFRDIWARIKRWNNYRELNSKVTMRFDAENLSPQAFIRWTLRNPHIIKRKLVVTTPCSAKDL